MKRVAAIIPAYNEEKTIGNVVEVLKFNPYISEIIVVDDGSFDNTSKVAKRVGARVISLSKNRGKAQAMAKGVRATKASILLFCDADLIGLKPENVDALLEPVLDGKVDMSIGTVDRKKLKKYIRWFVQKTDSPVAGQRALKKEVWELIPEKYKKKYYIESVLTYFAKINSLKVKTIVLEGVSHVIKEKKYGFCLGVGKRLSMFAQMVFVNIAIRLQCRRHNYGLNN